MRHYQTLGAQRFGELSLDDELTISVVRDNKAKEVLQQFKSGEISKEEGMALYRNINSMRSNEFIANYMKDSEIVGARSYVETLTLDPSAKVVNYDDLVKMKSKERSLYAEKYMKSHNFTETERAVFRREITLEKQGQTQWQLAKSWENSNPEEYDKFIKTHSDVFNRHVSKISNMDDGAYAALKGYDAINASGHGDSGSYTVILNRTKVIFKGGN